MTPPEIDIADWRRAVFALYADIRAAKDSVAAQAIWRAGREALFRRHPQSPLLDEPHRGTWTFHTYPYDIGLRHIVGLQEPVTEHSLSVPVGEDGVLQLRPLPERSALRIRWEANSPCIGSTAMAAGCSCPLPTRRTAGKPTVAVATSWIRSRAPTLVAWTISWWLTSILPISRPVRIRRAGRVRCHRRKIR